MFRWLCLFGVFLGVAAYGQAAFAETIRIAIGTQDTTINCAAGGLLIRELKLLDKFLPHDGKYKDATYDVEWKNFTSGAPITNEMVAGKLDFGAMGEFPAALNGIAFEKAGKHSLFISVLSGSVKGSGNGIVVPSSSPVQSLAELKGKTISVPFASTAHGMLLRAVTGLGWDPDKDVKIVAQAPEVAGSALQSGQIDAHADFVPFAELFPARGFARKIFDGAQAGVATFHGLLVDADYAEKYPEIVIAYLRAEIEANELLSAEPEKYSELIAKVTGVDAAVNYLFLGPLGLQMRDLTWKTEYRKDVATAVETLKILKRADSGLDVDTFITDKFVRAAFKASHFDYDAQLADYAPLSLAANDAATGKPITNTQLAAAIWLRNEPLVRNYATLESALKALAGFETTGNSARAVYAQDHGTGIKLLAEQAWFVILPNGQMDAFLLKGDAEAFAKKSGGVVKDFSGAKLAVKASL
jgi:NitT/TauT family transport system substrate-binding protein